MTVERNNTGTPRRSRALWIQSTCVALVCFGAAYVSYLHGREFALRFGADEITALALLLSVELLNRALKRHRAETNTETAETSERASETTSPFLLAVAPRDSPPVLELRCGAGPS